MGHSHPGLRLLGLMLGLVSLVLPARADQIIEVQGGGATLWRGGTSRPAPVGTILESQDRVHPPSGGRVGVRCQNGAISSRSRLFGVADVCPDSVAARYSIGGRGEDDFLEFLEGRFVYASQVIAENPVFRWDAVEGASSYHLQLRDCGQMVFNCTTVLWEETVTGATTLQREAALPMGDRNYELIVTALDGDGQEQVSYLALRRVGAESDAVKQVKEAIAHLSQQDVELTEEAVALSLSRIYLAIAQSGTAPPEGTGLVLEMLPILEAIAPYSQAPYLLRTLGDAYLQVGLLTAAQAAYEQTLRLTDATPDRASRAAAEVGLANIAAWRGDRATAYYWLQQARISYGWLGDENRLIQVQGWLEILEASR